MQIARIAPRLLSAIVTRMVSEGAESVSDAEIARTLGPCVCARRLIEAATFLRDSGELFDALVAV